MWGLHRAPSAGITPKTRQRSSIHDGYSRFDAPSCVHAIALSRDFGAETRHFRRRSTFVEDWVAKAKWRERSQLGGLGPPKWRERSHDGSGSIDFDERGDCAASGRAGRRLDLRLRSDDLIDKGLHDLLNSLFQWAVGGCMMEVDNTVGCIH